MRILIVEDDLDLCEVLTYHLKREGYTVDLCHSGVDAVHYIKQQAYDLIILDRMLPEQSGIEALSQVRAAGVQTHVIITTALNGIGDRIAGLDAGADDYLVKPFSVDELLARIRAVSRRSAHLEDVRLLTAGDISLDPVSCSFQGPKASYTLSRREADLLAALMKSPGKVLPRHILLAKVWGPDAPVEDGNLDNYIHFLRRRLKTCGSKTSIKTSRAVGYQLEVSSC